MTMRHVILFMMSVIVGIISASAHEYTYRFRSVPVSQALARISREHPELNISFIYNELEDYKVDADIATDDAVTAIRRLTSYNPISILVVGDRIFVEAMQRGRYKYSGRVVDEHGETIPFATVMLLAPKDSIVVTYGTTDAAGRFLIPCDRSRVIAKLSGVGYLPTYHTGRGFNFGDITMRSNAIQLKGVSVEATASTLSADRSIYTPSGRQKRAARDATDLLRIMSMPEVRVDAFSGAITDNFGRSIPVYINSMPASAQEMEGLRTADVRRVELLINPTDPRFQGAQRAINFIMQEYEYGGYTKLKADETAIAGFTNKSSVFSKFSYRKMVYDLYAGVTNESSRHNGNSTEGQYLLNDSEGNPVTVTRRQDVESSRFRQDQYPLTLRASYNSEKIVFRNTLGFTHKSRPRSNESGSLSYSPSPGGDSDYSFLRIGRNRNNSLTYSGTCLFILPHAVSVNLNPNFSYAHTNEFGDYTATNSEHVLRSTVENARYVRLNADIVKDFGKRHSVGMKFSIGRHSNDVRYSGTSGSNSDFSLDFMSGAVRYNYKSKRMSLYADAAVDREVSKINGHRATDVYPACHLEMNYAFNSKNRLSVFGQYATFSPETGEKTSDVLKDNELLYITGNPYLKNSRFSQLSLGYTWLPCNQFNASAYAGSEMLYERYTVAYQPYNDGTALLRTYINDGDFRHTKAGISFNWKTRDGRLSLTANPELNFYSTTGIYKRDLSSVFLRAGGSYYIGNCYLNVDYKKRFKELQNESNILQTGRNEYKIAGGWSNGALNLRLTASNIFSKGWRRFTREFRSPYYSENRITYASTYPPRVTLSVTYTFGYGKKVKRGNEIGEQQGASSAILN